MIILHDAPHTSNIYAAMRNKPDRCRFDSAGRHFFSLFYNADNAKHNTASGQCCMKASLNIYDAGRNKFIA